MLGGNLAAPWGVALAPSAFGKFGGDLLVGNFGFFNSEISAFTRVRRLDRHKCGRPQSAGREAEARTEAGTPSNGAARISGGSFFGATDRMIRAPSRRAR